GRSMPLIMIMMVIKIFGPAYPMRLLPLLIIYYKMVGMLINLGLLKLNCPLLLIKVSLKKRFIKQLPIGKAWVFVPKVVLIYRIILDSCFRGAFVGMTLAL